MPVAMTLYASALHLLEQLGLLLLIPVGAFALFLFILHFLTGERTSRKVRAQQKARDEAWKKRDEEVRRKRVERGIRRSQERRADPQWPETVLDHYLRWLLSSPDESSMHEWNRFRWFEGIHLTEEEVDQARDTARREGLAVHDGRGRRLTRRGRRIFEEYAGDRKRMSEAERRRHQPSIGIDARGAGTVEHTIEGDVRETTVNNMAPSTPTPTEVDLGAVLRLLERLRMTLPDVEGLSDLARARASGDLDEVDRELRAPAQDRDPRRVRAALERLTTALAGADGLVQVVNQLWDHLRGRLPS